MTTVIDPQLSFFATVSHLHDRELFARYRGSLTVISHEIEDALIRGEIHARVFAGFQKVSFFLPQLDRYRRLARSAESVYIFGYPDTHLPALKNIDFVPLREEDALYHEWFLIADAPDYFSALIAQDLTGFDVPSRLRRFRGVWTFDPATVSSLRDAASAALGLPPLEQQPRNFAAQLGRIELTVANLIQSLETRYEELRQAQALRRDLTDMMIHDLRSPLTAVAGNLELLERTIRQGDDAASQQFLKGAQESSEDLLTMINDILDINRIEGGEFRFEQEPVSVQALFEAALKRFTPLVELEQKKISASAPPDVRVYGDREVLLRVLANLIANALKYTQRRNGRIQLQADYDAGRGRTMITVRDNGTGIPPEMHQRIFEKFGQVRTDGNERRGFGLGLAFCRLSIDAQGGQIEVESEPGKGSAFIITLRSAPDIPGVNI